MSMHHETITKPIFDDFIKELKEYPVSAWTDEKWIGAAFYKAMCKNLEQLSIKNTIDRLALESTDSSYIDHIEEKTGYEIGKAINSNRDCYYLRSENTFYGREINKTVVLVKLHRQALEQLDKE